VSGTIIKTRSYGPGEAVSATESYEAAVEGERDSTSFRPEMYPISTDSRCPQDRYLGVPLYTKDVTVNPRLVAQY
jgi:hypothetical protein